MNDLQNKTIYNALSIIYDLTNEINLLESIGINVEGVIKENNIGSDIYQSITNAFSIIEDILIDAVGTAGDIIYNINVVMHSSKDSRENIIKDIMNQIEDMVHDVCNRT